MSFLLLLLDNCCLLALTLTVKLLSPAAFLRHHFLCRLQVNCYRVNCCFYCLLACSLLSVVIEGSACRLLVKSLNVVALKIAYRLNCGKLKSDGSSLTVTITNTTTIKTRKNISYNTLHK